jgi:hypothetical protein
MISIGLCGITTYLLFAFLGLGAYVLVVSKRGIRPTTLFVLPPFFGCAGVVLALTHCLSWRLAIPQASLAVLVAMGIPSLVAVFLARRELARALRRSMRSLRCMAWASTALLMGGLLLWSASRDDRLNSPYRLGIDQVGYITTAAVLMDGATLDTIESRLLADTMSRNRAEAMQRITSAVNYTNQLAAVFLFGAVRWGFSLLLVFLTTVLRLPHVAISVYPLLAVALSLLHGLVFLFCRSRWRSAGFAPCLAIASSVSLNANMLNVAFDGQLGQAFGLPFFFALWWQFTNGYAESAAVGFPSSVRLDRKAWKTRVIAVLAAIVILPSYGEFVILIAIVAVLSLPADAFLRISRQRRSCLAPYLFLAGTLAIALILLGGFGGTWLLNVVFTRFSDIHQAGWMQPYWANPLEILGFCDMYRSQSTRRLYDEIEFQVVVSVILLPLVLRGLAMSRVAWSGPWSGPPIVVALVYCKTRLVEKIHNYQYMKSYTATGPLLFILFAGCVLAALGLERPSALPSQRKRLLRFLCRILAVTVLSFPVVVGLESLRRFHTQGHFLCLEELESLSTGHDREILSRHVIFVPGNDPVATDSLAFHFPFHWLRKEPPQELAPYREWPVAVYINSETTPEAFAAVDSFPRPLLLTPQFLFCETGLSVSDLLEADGRTIDWSRLAAAVDAMIAANLSRRQAP